jgi:7-cyano-7-deazaguanine reductase
MTQELRYLGHASPAAITADEVETVTMVGPVELVTVTGHELQALCPVTGQPDIYTIVIEYTPRGRVIESKSLKLYLTSWRETGIMCEHLASAISADLSVAAGAPVRVTLKQQPRGGLSITASAQAVS